MCLTCKEEQDSRPTFLKRNSKVHTLNQCKTEKVFADNTHTILHDTTISLIQYTNEHCKIQKLQKL